MEHYEPDPFEPATESATPQSSLPGQRTTETSPAAALWSRRSTITATATAPSRKPRTIFKVRLVEQWVKYLGFDLQALGQRVLLSRVVARFLRYFDVLARPERIMQFLTPTHVATYLDEAGQDKGPSWKAQVLNV